MRKRTRSVSFCGSMWMSEARSRNAWVRISLTTRTMGASSRTVASTTTARWLTSASSKALTKRSIVPAERYELSIVR